MDPFDDLRPEALPAPDSPTYSESGVDLTLLQWMLTLTYKERLDALQNLVRFAGKVKHGRQDSGVREPLSGP
jgi:hypothetical protein